MQEIKSLMLGDWVNVYSFPNDNPKEKDLYPARVTSISVFDPYKNPNDITVEVTLPRTKGIASRPYNTCIPIRLTFEILVANGYLFDGTTYDWFRESKHKLKIFGFCAPFLVLGGVEITYVHELQHALRLCGEDEVADNFKVE